MTVDLHTHSTESDGTQSPAELVAEAARQGLGVIALTDHDTSTGWAEAAQAGQQHGVRVLPGVEISCQHRHRSVHLLGYGFDPARPGIAAELARARRSRLTRMQSMVERMSDDGIPITYAEVLAQASAGATVGRPHLADALVAKGLVATRDEAFANWLSSTSRYHVGHYAPSVMHAVQLVAEAGGVSVLAHPFSRGYRLSPDLVAELAQVGLDGLEVGHPDHDPVVETRARALADRLGLLATGSSDYHGAGKATRLGDRTTPPEVLAEIDERLASRAGHRST